MLVFSLFIILFIFSWFIFCSCDSICSRLLDFALFPFSKVGGTFWLGSFCLVIFNVCGTVFLHCWLFIFWCIFSISRSENQPFFIIVLTWSASLWLVVWKLEKFLPDLYYSFPIPSLCQVAPKIAVLCKLVVSPILCFVFTSLVGGVP